MRGRIPARRLLPFPGPSLLGRIPFALLAGLLMLAAQRPIPAAPPSSGSLAPDAVAPLLARIQSDASLDENLKNQAAAKAGEAQQWIQESAQLQRQIDSIRSLVEKGSREVEKLRSQLDEVRRKHPPSVDRLVRLPQSEIEKRLNRIQARLQQIKQSLSEAEQALSEYISAAKTGGEEIVRVRNQLEESRKALQTLGESGIDPRLLPIQQAWLQTQSRWLQARLDYLTLRQNNLGLLTDLAQARRDLMSARLDALQKEADAYRQALQQIRQQAAERETRQARSAARQAPPELRMLQERITRLLQEKQQRVAEEATVTNRLDAVRKLLDDIRSDRDRIRHLVEMGGSGGVLSTILQKRLAALPSLQELRQESLQLQARLNEAVMHQLELDEQLRATQDLSDALERLLHALKEDLGGERIEALRATAEELLRQQRDTLTDLLKTNTQLISRLSELDADLRQLRKLVADYRSYLNEQLLWMPSTRSLPLSDPVALVHGIQWHLAPGRWKRVGLDLVRAVRERPEMATLLLLATLGLLVSRTHLRRHLDRLGEATRSVRTDSWTASLFALADTLLLALPLPLLLAGPAWLVQQLDTASTGSRIVSEGLMATAQVLLALDFLRILCRDRGLAQRHLRWYPSFCRELRRELAWFLPLTAVLTYLTATGGTGEGRPDEVFSLGRVAFGVLMAATLVLVWRLGRLRAPALAELGKRRPHSPWIRYHALWFPLALLVPVALILSSLLGYYYSALYLAERVHLTLWSLLALYITRDLLLRALTLTQRRLRFEEALRRREERHQAGESVSREAPPSGDNLVIEEPEPDINQLSAQVRQLLQTGYFISVVIVVWFIWADIIPALHFLDTVTLPITTSRMVDGVPREVPMTLGDLLSGLLLAGFTLLAARNLPAVLELTLLQRLPLSRGAAYAIKAIAQYTVALLGIVLIFNSLGLQWSSIQWLVAALGVGLGFGLQEIVANFVSGIILLFEQPIRVGDVVTVEGITGTVTRIRIRATTIVNWDRQELVIPNKSFITGQLINWTLSDTVNRVIITVGVAYGSDVENALALLEEAAREHPLVLDDPPPRVTFEEFGDNALTLRLRAYLDDLDYRLTLITDLHRMINEKYAAAGIEIAFPQRDLHLDTRRPLEIVLREEAKDS